MNTITIRENATTTNTIAHAINNANTGVFASMYELGLELSQAHKAEEFRLEGYKSWNAFKKANIDNRNFKMGASSLDNAEKMYDFLQMECVEYCSWTELSWSASVILMNAVKFNDKLVEFVNEFSTPISKMKQKELQRFAKLLKDGATIEDAFKSATKKMPAEETVGSAEPSEGEGEGVETKIAIKASLQNILAMMKAKDYDNAENTLEELLATM